MSRPSNKEIIELYGLPGAGKTTLAKRLVAEYGFVLSAPILKKTNYLTLTVQYPSVVYAWLKVITKNHRHTKNWSLFTYNVSLLFSSLQKINEAFKSSAPAVIVDEGLVQRLLSYSDVVLTEKEIKTLLKISPKGRTIFFVNDREVLGDRYSPSHVRTKLGEEYLAKWKHNLKQNLTLVTHVLGASPDVDLIESKDMSADDILQKLTESTS